MGGKHNIQHDFDGEHTWPVWMWTISRMLQRQISHRVPVSKWFDDNKRVKRWKLYAIYRDTTGYVSDRKKRLTLETKVRNGGKSRYWVDEDNGRTNEVVKQSKV